MTDHLQPPRHMPASLPAAGRSPPLVSVLVHCRQDAARLAACLDSVFAQDHANVEIILYDFASSDDTWEIATAYQARYPGAMTVLRVRRDYCADRLVDHLQNVRGKYFLRIHGHCVLRPGLISECARCLEADAGIALVRLRTAHPGIDGREVSEPALYESSCVVDGLRHAARILIDHPAPHANAGFFRSDIMKANTGDSAYLTELKLSLGYRIAYRHEPGLAFLKAEAGAGADARMIEHYLRLYLDKRDFMSSLRPEHGALAIPGGADPVEQLARHLIDRSGMLAKAGQTALATRLRHLAAAIAPKAGADRFEAGVQTTDPVSR